MDVSEHRLMDSLDRICNASELLKKRVVREDSPMTDCLRRSRARQKQFAQLLGDSGWEIARQPFEVKDGKASNQIARWPYRNSEPIILFGCHPDYCAGEGANDNGTGMAVAAEVSRLIADTEAAEYCGFAAFDMEERGLLGSRAYIQQGRPLPQWMINVDAIGNGDLFAMQSAGNEQLVAGLANAAHHTGGTLHGMDSTAIQISSDHVPFWSKGVTATTIISFSNPVHDILAARLENGERYRRIMAECSTANKPADLRASVDPKNMVAAVRMILKWL